MKIIDTGIDPRQSMSHGTTSTQKNPKYSHIRNHCGRLRIMGVAGNLKCTVYLAGALCMRQIRMQGLAFRLHPSLMLPSVSMSYDKINGTHLSTCSLTRATCLTLGLRRNAEDRILTWFVRMITQPYTSPVRSKLAFLFNLDRLAR